MFASFEKDCVVLTVSAVIDTFVILCFSSQIRTTFLLSSRTPRNKRTFSLPLFMLLSQLNGQKYFLVLFAEKLYRACAQNALKNAVRCSKLSQRPITNQSVLMPLQCTLHVILWESDSPWQVNSSGYE